jgi:hypothetical protein
MKKLFALTAVVVLAGCAEKAPLAPEQQWQGYCKSVGNAARTILLDRQNAIEKQAAIDHAEKLEDPTTKKFILEIIEEVYQLPSDQINDQPDAQREKIRAQVTERCQNTPFDEIPEYKPF